nr:ComEC/Rec2 family competence protein [uncultured Porphyromonas sp.]
MIEDHWLASPIFRLLALLITGYLSYELIPHRWLSYGLAIGGGCAFSLGALASLRGGRALSGVWGAQRQLSRGLRLGLYLLLILSARLYYAHTMERSTGGLLPLGGKLTAIIEAQEASPEPIGEGGAGTEAVGSRIGEVGSAINRAVHGAEEGAPSDSPRDEKQGGATSIPRQQGAYQLHLRLLSPSGASSLLLLSLRSVPKDGENPLQVGDTLTFHLQRVSYTCDLLHRRPSYGRYLLSLGAVGRGMGEGLYVRPSSSVSLLATSPRLLALRLRDRLAERLSATSLRRETKRLLLGMTLGLVAHDAEGRALRQSFARGGVAHLLAVSGFHLAVVVGAMALLLGALPKLRRRERLRWALLLVVAWTFTLISGCSVPTLRASGMLTLYAGGRILRRPTSFVEVLALPALLQLACSPLSLFSASFLLTYLALVSIRLFYRPIWGMLGKLQHPLMRYLWGCLALSLAVQPLLFPLSLYLFGTSSLAYLWTTLLVLPLATLLIPVGLLLMLVLSLGFVPPMPILGLMDQGASLLYEGVAWAEGLPLLQVHLPLSLPMLVGYYALLALLFLLSSALRDKPTPIALPA